MFREQIQSIRWPGFLLLWILLPFSCGQPTSQEAFTESTTYDSGQIRQEASQPTEPTPESSTDLQTEFLSDIQPETSVPASEGNSERRLLETTSDAGTMDADEPIPPEKPAIEDKVDAGQMAESAQEKLPEPLVEQTPEPRFKDQSLPSSLVKRIVLAGDSWSTGLIQPTRDALDYAHNFGILQHTYGDGYHAPFPVPNPVTHPAYKPGVAPKPGIAPSYHPYPGGFIDYPAPLDYMPDGIHPNPKGFRTIIDHTLDQGLANWIHKKSWN